MTVDLAAAYAHCEAELKSLDRDSWLATLFAPADTRRDLQAIGAFVLELGQVRSRVRQPIAGEIRLQWWQDVVDGGRSSEAAAHPVAAALVDTLNRTKLPRDLIGSMIDALRIALYDEPPADVAALEERCVAVRGTPIRLAAQVLGKTGEPIAAAAAQAGVGLGLWDLVRELQHGAGRHPVPLPQDLLLRCDATQGEIDAGRITPGRTRVLADLRSLARSHVAALRSERKRLGGAGPAFLTASLVEPRLRHGERAEPSAIEADLPQWRRQWLLWRAARRGGVL